MNAKIEERTGFVFKHGQDDLEYTLQPRGFTDLGDGSVIVVAFADSLILGGTVICVWDGRIHIDVNLFTSRESYRFLPMISRPNFANKITQHLVPVLLKDEMPRG